MWWRIFYGSLKFITGFVLLKWASADPTGFFYGLMRHEIIEDPGDIFIQLVRPLIERISSSTSIFIAIYLIFWGAIDVWLAINILRHKLRAFVTAMWLILLFVLYEIYRLSYTHSLALLAIVFIDLAILWIIFREYKILKASHKPSS